MSTVLKMADKKTTTAPLVALAPPRSLAMASLALAMLLPSLGTSVANMALPALAQSFACSFQEVQWVVLAYLLASTTLIVSVGKLGDLVGHRRLLLGGILLFSAGCGVAAAAPALGVLVAARALQGLGAAVMMVLSVAFVAETVPRDQVGKAMGLLGTTSAIGTALGPSLGGLLISGFGWRAIFLANLLLGLCAWALASRCLPARQSTRSVQPAFDFVGTCLLAATLSAYCLGMTMGRGSFGTLSVLLLVGAALGLCVFLRVQSHTAHPLIQLRLFRQPELCVGLPASGLVATVLMATMVVGPFYLTYALQLSAAQVGMVASVGPLAAALAGVPAGRLVDRLGAPRMMLTGMMGIALGATLLALLSMGHGVPAYVASMVVITAGYALFQAANNTTVMTAVAADERGVVSGLLNLSRNIGLISGTTLMGALFTYASGHANVATAPAAAVATGMRGTFGVAAVILAGACVGAAVSMLPSWRSGLVEKVN